MLIFLRPKFSLMNKINLGFLALLSLSVCSTYAQKAATEITKDQKEVISALDNKKDHDGDVSKQIWDLAEVGYKEVKSAAILEEEPILNMMLWLEIVKRLWITEINI